MIDWIQAGILSRDFFQRMVLLKVRESVIADHLLFAPYSPLRLRDRGRQYDMGYKYPQRRVYFCQSPESWQDLLASVPDGDQANIASANYPRLQIRRRG